MRRELLWRDRVTGRVLSSALTDPHLPANVCHSELMLDHLGIQCADMDASKAFYDAVLAPLGATRQMDFGVAVGYGTPEKPDFWLGVFDSGKGFRESHIAFAALDRAAVRAFFDAAVAAGAEVLHEPRVWPEYHGNYYGAFVRDPDGNNVEAVCHLAED
jgi:catechol 2,3-dioxygenase-like lactoylglutathione lyase family enzyme